MVFREVWVVEVREVLRAWLDGVGLRTVAERAGVDRKTARRYVAAAQAAGVVRDGGQAQLTDEVIGTIVAAVRPVRTSGHGASWEALEAERERITEWVKQDLSVGRGRDHPFEWPPAQIPACGTTAPGSCLGLWLRSGLRGRGASGGVAVTIVSRSGSSGPR